MNELFGLLSIIVFVFGIIVGSFLNVVVLRFKTGKGIGGRSFCFSCRTTLAPLELIPVVSFFLQGGRCRTCRTPLSWQYPIVEFTTGFVFFVVFVKTLMTFSFNPAITLFYFWFMFALLIVIAVYDFKHKIIPDSLSYSFAFLSLVWLLATHPVAYFSSLQGLLDVVAGPLLFLPFYLIWLLSQGRWMGLGDGKLALGIGWFLGFASGLSAIAFGFWIATIVMLAVMLLQKLFRSKRTFFMSSEIPFAPFLILGTFIAYYFNPDLFSINVFILGF